MSGARYYWAAVLGEATLYGDTPKLPAPLDKQMPALLESLYRAKESIVARRKTAQRLGATFAVSSLVVAERGVDTAIGTVRDSIPSRKMAGASR